MKTSDHNQLRQDSETDVAAPTGATDTGVSRVSAGIAEVLRMRVGCWQAPISLWAGPTAA
jgi:hypothetical protein